MSPTIDHTTEMRKMTGFEIVKTDRYLAYDIYKNGMRVNMGFESEASAQYWIDKGYAEEDYQRNFN